SLNPTNKLITNNMEDGEIMAHTFKEENKILDKFAKDNRAWYNIETDSELGNHSRKGPSELQIREIERDQDMTHIKAQIELITKYLTTINTQNYRQ
ncbi:hypothetical protein HAX54_018649, partial [Datura stramonium]|nr:hypothetical protein [Datura stramonium]